MKSAALLLTFFFAIQGPLCAVDDLVTARAALDAKAGSRHDCCPQPQGATGGSEPAPLDGRTQEADQACMIHCASLAQALSPSMHLVPEPQAIHLAFQGSGSTIAGPGMTSTTRIDDLARRRLDNLSSLEIPLLI